MQCHFTWILQNTNFIFLHVDHFLHVYTLFVTSCGMLCYNFLFKTYLNGMTELHKFVSAQQTVTILSVVISPEPLTYSDNQLVVFPEELRISSFSHHQ